MNVLVDTLSQILYVVMPVSSIICQAWHKMNVRIFADGARIFLESGDEINFRNVRYFKIAAVT